MGLRVIQRTGGKEKRCKSLNATLLLQMEGEMEGTGLIFSCDTENTNPWTFRSTGCIRGKKKTNWLKGTTIPDFQNTSKWKMTPGMLSIRILIILENTCDAV